MTHHKILIQKKDMQGDLALFAPAVKREAEIYFSSELSGYRVIFPYDSPFNSPGDLDSQKKKRIVPHKATQGIYQFRVEHRNDKAEHGYDLFADLQLTVARHGVDCVGFSVEQGKDGPELHTQLWAPRGSVTFHFAKDVVNEEVALSVFPSNKRAAPAPIKIAAGSTRKQTKGLKLEDKLWIKLDPPRNRPLTQESGGTRVVDIIVEPP